jgi:phospholipid/cholesterol/gamma-HCH transport system substrate-binding protein
MSSAISTGPAAIKLALFTAVTVMCTTVLALAISNADFSAKTSYSGIFRDAVGVFEGDDVRLHGVRVGAVESVSLHDNSVARVTFTVDEGVELTTTTQLALRYRNLIGQRYLAIVEQAGGDPLPAEHTIPMSQTSPALNLTALFNGFRPLLNALEPAEVNALAYELVRVLQGEGGTVTRLLVNVTSLTDTLADRDELIGQVLDNLNAVLGPLDVHGQQLSELILQMQRLLTGLAQDREAIGSSLVSIGDLTATTGDLLEEGRPALAADITQLGEVAEGLGTPTNQKLTDDALQSLPPKLAVVKPLVSYGSWINFYLCAVNFRTGPGPNDATAPIIAEAARCRE